VIDHSDEPSDGHIELSIPARRELLQLVRMTAGVVAARLNLGLNDVDDLRLAVEELCLSLVGPTGDTPGRLVLRYEWDHDTIDVACTLCPEDGPSPSGVRQRDHVQPESPVTAPVGDVRIDLSSQILDALVDDHGETDVDGHPGAWLRMRRIRPEDS